MRSYLTRPKSAYQTRSGLALLPEGGRDRMIAASPPLPLPTVADVPSGHILVDVHAALLCHSDRTQGERPDNRGGSSRGLEEWLPDGGRVILHEAALKFRWGGPEVLARSPGLRPVTCDAGTALTMHTLHSNLVRFFVNSDRRDYDLAQAAILATPAEIVEGFFTEMDSSYEALARRFWDIWDRPSSALIRTGVWFRDDDLPPID